MTIGERIKYCRKRIHMTQNDLAEATGIHPVTIRKYETNKIVPVYPFNASSNASVTLFIFVPSLFCSLSIIT